MKRESFNDEELKKIIVSVLVREFKENDLDYSVAAGTFTDFKKAIKNNKKFSKKGRKAFLDSVKFGTIAYHSNSNKNIVFFTDRIRTYDTLEKQLFITIFSCFHEVRHAIQLKFDDFSYEKFLYDVENIFRENHLNHYYHNNNHELYSFEIGADLYAITKTIKLMKEIYPKAYEKEKKYIEDMREKIEDNYFLYDAYYYITYLYNDIKNNKKVPDNKVLKIFFNEDGSLKRMDEIIQNENFEKLDKRIVYNMLSSHLALTNIEEESEAGVLLLQKSNEYALEVTLNQEKYIEKKRK